MWVKIAEPADIVKQELDSNAHLTVTRLGKTFSWNDAVGEKDDMGTFFSVKTPLNIIRIKTALKNAVSVTVTIYKYLSPIATEIVHSSTRNGTAGINALPIMCYIPPGNYLIRLQAKDILISDDNTQTDKHQFLSLIGGTTISGNIPSWQQDIDPRFSFGLYGIQIAVPNKSLYLGIHDHQIDDQYLIAGAFYFLRDNNKMYMFVFDGQTQHPLMTY